LNHTVIQCRVRVSHEIGAGVEVTGEVGRVDLTAQGYSIYLFTKVLDPWRDDLRMPLLHTYFCQKFGVPASVVEIGVYSMETAQYESTSYSDQELAAATREAKQLARRLVTAQSRLGGATP
jgi:hypothetical protein